VKAQDSYLPPSRCGPATHPTLLRGEKRMQTSSKLSRTKPCPPHTPLLVQDAEDGYCLVRCLACGLQGPKRENTSKARLAFDEYYK
jgi:hypothetical protein